MIIRCCGFFSPLTMRPIELVTLSSRPITSIYSTYPRIWLDLLSLIMLDVGMLEAFIIIFSRMSKLYILEVPPTALTQLQMLRSVIGIIDEPIWHLFHCPVYHLRGPAIRHVFISHLRDLWSQLSNEFHVIDKEISIRFIKLFLKEFLDLVRIFLTGCKLCSCCKICW